MNETEADKQAREYATAYVNGNRESTCRDILECGCAAVMASKVAVRICREDFEPVKGHSDGPSDMVEEFIRILEATADNQT